jgi:hypothetical protein
MTSLTMSFSAAALRMRQKYDASRSSYCDAGMPDPELSPNKLFDLTKAVGMTFVAVSISALLKNDAAQAV